MTDHPQLQDLAGYDLGTHVVEYDDRTVILYALAVGARANELELIFERDLRAELGETFISTHLEPVEDEIAFHDRA